MVVSLYAVLMLIIAVLSRRKFKRWVNTLSIFSFIWLFFGSVSSLGVTGFRVPSTTVYIYSTLFVTIVNTIVLTFSRTQNIEKTDDSDIDTIKDYNSTMVQLIAMVLISPMVINSFRVFTSSLSFSAVRLAYFGGGIFNNAISDLAFRQLPMGMLHGMLIFYVYHAFETKQNKYIGMAVFNTLLITFVNGGRYAIMMLIYSITIMWLNDNTLLINVAWIRKYKKQIKRVVIATLLILIVLSMNRGQVIVNSLFSYFSGSLSYIDYILINPSTFSLEDKLWGYLTFGFIFEPIVLLLKVLGITEAKIPSYYFNIVAQRYYNVGDGATVKMMNANTSILYYFLRDFGPIGVVLGAVLIGVLTVNLYNRWRNNNNAFAGMLYLYMCNVLFNSLMTNQLFGSTPFFIFFTLVLCTKVKKIPIKITLRNMGLKQWRM